LNQPPMTSTCGFVAFLVQKLLQNNRILTREIPRICKHFGFFGHNFGTYKTLIHEIGSLDRPMTSSNKPQTYPAHDVINQKPQAKNLKLFFRSKLQGLMSLYRVWIAL